MPAQWLHVETYALGARRRRGEPLRWTVRQVIAEAYREVGACPHVASPQPPTILHGDPTGAEVIAQCGAALDAARDTRGRRLRCDASVLMSVVASHPEPLASADAEARARMERWEKRVVAWVKDRWGQACAAILRHLDEGYWHLHALIVAPVRDARLRMDEIHPGVAGREVARETRQGARLARRAYRNGMRVMQDDFWREVSAPEGHDRVGPQRLRLTRAEWTARRAERERLAERMQRVEEAERALAGADAVRLAAVAAAQKRRADDAEERARMLEGALAEAEALAVQGREALALLARARAEAAEVESRGGWQASRTPAEREARVLDRLRAAVRVA